MALTPDQRAQVALANTLRAERGMVHFIEDLAYFLDPALAWRLTADEIAHRLGVKQATFVERRLDRLGITETPLAEAFRRRKPGYCTECRKVGWSHEVDCTYGWGGQIPERARRRTRANARTGVA